MKEAALKIDLYDKIEHADSIQLKEIYGLITNYFNGNEAIEEWDLMPGAHKAQMEKGLEQADAGLGTTLKDVNERLMAKYNIG